MRLIDADALLEQIQDFNCKDCQHYNFVRCRACPIDDAVAYIDEAPTVGEWISVEDKLPKVYNAYLAIVDGEVEEVTFNPTSIEKQPWSHCSTEGFEFLKNESVTYWMPLPEPPKEAKQDET